MVSQRFLRVLCGFLALLMVAGAANTLPHLQLQVFSLDELKFPNATVLDALRAAVFDVGMFAVTGFDEGSSRPGAPEGRLAFAGALQAFVRCAQAGHMQSLLHEVELQDRTVRSTIATATNRSVVAPLPAAVTDRCPEFAHAAARLRRAVDMTGRVYGRLLDRLVYGLSSEGQVDSRKGGSFVSAVLSAESLEHFHMFARPADAPVDEQASLEMHADMGLFIVMTAAEYYLLDGGERPGADRSHLTPGLRLELPDGQVVVPLFPANSLLVMNGEGSSLWMRGADAWADRPYAPAHEVRVPNITGVVRTWFGRMFFPPRDAVLQSPEAPGLTFSSYRDQTYDAFHRGAPGQASTLGCSPSRRLLMDEGSCGADEMLCWMTCMSSAHLNCSSTADMVCGDPSAPGKLWPQNYLIDGQPTHCFGCQLECLNSAPVAAPASAFCNSNLSASTMWMTGFQFVKGSSYPCVAYLFPEWPLDSAVKFAFACIGTFLMGVVIPALTYCRTFITASILSKAGLYERVGKKALLVAVYAVGMTLAYWLMLVVMTYQAELFIAAVVGLTFGYWLFSIFLVHEVEEEDCAKHVEPCCSA